MATRREETRYELNATDNASRVFRQVESSTQRLSSSYQQLTGALATLASAGFVNAAIRKAQEAEQAQNRLSAVIKATGGAAGLAREEYDQLADSLAEVTQFDDESLRGAQATLVKFGNIHGQVFRDALKLSADLAAFMGSDVPEAAQMLGRSLQSPTEGLTLMERQFGKLTQAQEEHVNELVRQGRAVEAQNAVLDIWRQKIGGVAEQMNTGLTKATRDVAKAWNELLETLGKEGSRLNRSLEGATTLMKDFKGELEGAKTPLGDLAAATLDWLATLRFIPGAIGMVGQAAREQQLAMDRQRRTQSGRIRNPELEDIQAFEAGLASYKPVVLGGKTDEKDSAKKEMEAWVKSAQDAVETAESLVYTWDEFGNRITMTKEEMESIADVQQKALKAATDESKRAAEIWVRAADELQAQSEDLVYTWDQFGNRLTLSRDAWEAMQDQIRKAGEEANRFEGAINNAFDRAVRGAESATEVIKNLIRELAYVELQKRVFEPVSKGLSAALDRAFGGSGSAEASLNTMAGAAVQGLPAYAAGTDYVPRTGLALVHQGERIIPASENAGGVTQVINFSASTPAAVRDAVFAMLPQLAQAARAAVNDDKARGRR